MQYLKQFYMTIKNSRSKGYAKIFYIIRNHFIYHPKIIPENLKQYLKQFYMTIKNSLNFSLSGNR